MIGFKYIAAEVLFGEFTEATACPRAHRAGVILLALNRNETNVILRPFKPDRLTGHAHADFKLWADGHPLDIRAKSINEEAVALMPAVIADKFAQQAT